MNKKKLAFLCLLAGVLCACNQHRETNATVTPAEISITPFPIPEVTIIGPENTKTPLVTGKPENSPTVVPTEELLPLSPTPEPEGEQIPIDEAHFTSAVFREYIAEYYDRNKDGYLSDSERATVTEIYIGYSEDEFDGECLDGFAYFPNLVNLDISSAKEVVLQNHSNVKYFGGEEGYVGTIFIENCPALINIGFYHHGVDSLYISKVSPRARFIVTGCYLNHLVLDADLTLRVESDHGSEPLPISGEDFNGIENIEFLHQNETTLPFSEKYWNDYFENFNARDFAYMSVQILEKIEDIYDEQGRKGWNICIDRKIDAYSKMVFSVYTEEQPEPEQIFVRPAGFEEVKILEYSPNRGGSFHIIWELEVVYVRSSGESVLGTMTEDQYWTIAADGTKTRYKSEKEWQKNESTIKYDGELKSGSVSYKTRPVLKASEY